MCRELIRMARSLLHSIMANIAYISAVVVVVLSVCCPCKRAISLLQRAHTHDTKLTGENLNNKKSKAVSCINKLISR